MSEQELTPGQQLITYTTKFAWTLHSAGCPPEFICEQAFKYALAEQRYQSEMEAALKGIYDSEFPLESPGTMLVAAEVLVKVVTVLGIYPKQVER